MRALLDCEASVDIRLVQDAGTGAIEADAIIVAASLRDVADIAALKSILAQSGQVSCKLFVLDRAERSLVVQAHSLGATDTIFAPVAASTLRAKLARAGRSGLRRVSIGSCAAALESIFTDMSTGGRSLDLQRACHATEQIIGSVSENGLTAWLDDVRHHHEGTFQHCLLVTGVAVDFGMSLGFTGPDLLNLGLAATLHDIGKAGISLGILEKPGRLDRREKKIMERHPVIGYEAIKWTAGLAPDVSDAVLHHHEYLDGTGYPDRLPASAISDLTRILTISDIFAALIEKRRYKPAMPRPAAYKILGDMEGKLETPLVAAFRSSALLR
jgi:putative nucleotidyltransferase with HDIG domain